jgi:hypothetical protein
MDNFAAGSFYCYNVEDGPAFGISGFLHGILSGAMAYAHLFSPENSVLASNFLGVWLASLAVLLVLRVFADSCSLVVVGWAATLAASSFFVQTAFQGLETPLHLGVVLLCFWAYLRGAGRTMWLCCALAVVSKLDAVPIVAVLGTMRVAQVFDRSRPMVSLLEEFRSALVWAGIPLAAWLAFAFVVFGGPMPQTAYAKLRFHPHPLGRLAFVLPWWSADGYRIAAYAGISLTFAAACLIRRNSAGKCVAFALASLGVLALYCKYNPVERMPWYYVLPQTLLVLGAAAALVSLPRLIARGKAAAALHWTICAVLLATLPLSIQTTRRSARLIFNYLLSTEPERIAVGEWIRAAASPGERLAANHGHIARNSHLYVYDFSGLNSPVVTRLWREGKSPLVELRPDWVARHGLMPPEEQEKPGFRLAASFYGVSLTGWPAWRVWKKEPWPPGEHPCLAVGLADDEIAGDGKISRGANQSVLHVQGSRIVLRAPVGATPRELLFGIVRQEAAFELTVSRGAGGERLATIEVPRRDWQDPARGATLSCRVPLDIPAESSEQEIILTSSPDKRPPEPLWILEPAWVVESAKATTGVPIIHDSGTGSFSHPFKG